MPHWLKRDWGYSNWDAAVGDILEFPLCLLSISTSDSANKASIQGWLCSGRPGKAIFHWRFLSWRKNHWFTHHHWLYSSVSFNLSSKFFSSAPSVMHSPLICLHLKENPGKWVRRAKLQANCFWALHYSVTDDNPESWRGHYSSIPLRQIKKD